MVNVKITGLIFSKDRAMQLDALLNSIYAHCRNVREIDLQVLYITSDAFHDKQYQTLSGIYNNVIFIREHHFKAQVLSATAQYGYVLFMVDDSVFVRDCSIDSLVSHLKANNDALGFSLRLGKNTTYNYPRDISQTLPRFTVIGGDVLKFDWTAAEGDFGYPLELSSSLYRTDDIFPLLQQIEFANPNTLEGNMAASTHSYSNSKNSLLCGSKSIAFSNPANIVQNVCQNRVGKKQQYSTHELGLMFEQGYRIDTEKYSGFTPNACHQEVEQIGRAHV